jgi:hypothetical protein
MMIIEHRFFPDQELPSRIDSDKYMLVTKELWLYLADCCTELGEVLPLSQSTEVEASPNRSTLPALRKIADANLVFLYDRGFGRPMLLDFIERMAA